MNEGAARGLTDKFKLAIENSRIPSYTNHHVPEETRPKYVDAEYVYRFLSWLVDEPHGPYFTRSRTVVHLAICLSEVGYKLGVVESWDGQGHYDRHRTTRSVVLVTGGQYPTDPPMDKECFMESHRGTVHHYQFSTVGGMISTSFRNRCRMPPEVFQTEFEQIWGRISTDMVFQWTADMQGRNERDAETGWDRRGESGWGPLRAKAVWHTASQRSSSIALRLASLMFKNIAEHVAWCYESLARPEALLVIMDHYQQNLEGVEQHAEVMMRYRAITSCIIISIIGQLAPEDFKSVPHAVRWDLLHVGALEGWCKTLDDTATHGLWIGQAVLLLACIHAGYPTSSPRALSQEKLGNDIFYSVGYRGGMYAIIPSVLLHMKPTTEAIGLRCFYGFWANAVVRGSGLIVSSRGRHLDSEATPDDSSVNEAALIHSYSTDQPCVSAPVEAGPDVPLYLSIERSTYKIHKEEPELVLSGRVSGTSVGAVGVEQVVGTLINSFSRKKSCPGHDEQLCMAVVVASRWAKNVDKPVGLRGNHDTFVQVRNDDCWGLFLAGEVSNFGGLLVQGCIQCAASALRDGTHRVAKTDTISVIVGY